MTLIPDWRLILKKAWSIRLIALAAVLSGAEVVLPMFGDMFSRGIFAGLSFAVVIGAMIARVCAQKDM